MPSDSDEEGSMGGFFREDEGSESSTFISYDSYDMCCKSNMLTFHYSLRDTWSGYEIRKFKSEIHLKQNLQLQLLPGVPEAVFNIGMVLLQWYWMGFTSKRMDVRAGPLDSDQTRFWLDLYHGVSAEYYMENSLDLQPDLHLTCSCTSQSGGSSSNSSSGGSSSMGQRGQHCAGACKGGAAGVASAAGGGAADGADGAMATAGAAVAAPISPEAVADSLAHLECGCSKGCSSSTTAPSSTPSAVPESAVSSSSSSCVRGSCQVSQVSASSSCSHAGCSNGSSGSVLVPLGAGKDSITLFEMLKASGAPCRWFYLGGCLGEFDANWRFAAVARTSGSPEVLLAEHHWDVEDVWEQHRPRHLQQVGHSWAALVAFVSSLVALLSGCSTIAVGNDRSANVGNGSYQGVVVNHQYDKGLEFESAARDYIQQYITPHVYYFSGLSHLWEMQIAKRFVRLCCPAYLPLFTSCNETSGSRWCAACPKCLFVALLLAAFLPPTQVMSVFGDDLLEQEALRPSLLQLAGRAGRKPLECVGTEEEVRLALHLARGQYAALWPGYTPRLLRDWQDDPVELAEIQERLLGAVATADGGAATASGHSATADAVDTSHFPQFLRASLLL